MIFGSLFAGAGGFDLALDRAGFSCAWQVEIDKQCRSVLRRHWPDVLQLDDVRRVRAALEPKNARRTAIRLQRPDLLCGGFPCQDISVAGRRKGLAGSRSGLWYEFRRIAALLAPRWLLIENVDGLRSSNGGRDLGAILKALGDMGYWWAYRVFDSQWFGVAQRRERVFIVGHLGAVRGRAFPVDRSVCGLPAEVLFERDCLPWHPARSRSEGQEAAPCVRGGTDSGSNECGNKIAFRQNAKGGSGRSDGESETFIPVAHTLRGEGFDASEDGTGRGTPLIAYGFDPGQSSNAKATDQLTVNGAPPLPAGQGAAGRMSVSCGASVRRLTPRECERLQGFPDDWTRYDADGNELADSPRYRMMGNAVTVNVVRWIARRIIEANSCTPPTP